MAPPGLFWGCRALELLSIVSIRDSDSTSSPLGFCRSLGISLASGLAELLREVVQID